MPTGLCVAGTERTPGHGVCSPDAFEAAGSCPWDRNSPGAPVCASRELTSVLVAPKPAPSPPAPAPPCPGPGGRRPGSRWGRSTRGPRGACKERSSCEVSLWSQAALHPHPPPPAQARRAGKQVRPPPTPPAMFPSLEGAWVRLWGPSLCAYDEAPPASPPAATCGD